MAQGFKGDMPAIHDRLKAADCPASATVGPRMMRELGAAADLRGQAGIRTAAIFRFDRRTERRGKLPPRSRIGLKSRPERRHNRDHTDGDQSDHGIG